MKTVQLLDSDGKVRIIQTPKHVYPDGRVGRGYVTCELTTDVEDVEKLNGLSLGESVDIIKTLYDHYEDLSPLRSWLNWCDHDSHIWRVTNT